MKKIFFLIALCFSSNLLMAKNTGGGTVVGNGAGIVENNFQYAYSTIFNITTNCISNRKCSLTEEEMVILDNINAITRKNANKKDRLVFMSEKENPGFFTTGSSENFRIAKTFLNSDSPIYINTDMLYNEAGRPLITQESIIRILVHELGHQTGIEEHAGLDMLGVKIANFSEERTMYYRYHIEEEVQNVMFTVTNFEMPVKSSMISFNWKDQYIEDLTDEVYKKAIKCKYPTESYSGLEVTNGHFNFENNNLLTFEAWINIQCFESFSGYTNAYRKTLIIKMDTNYRIMELTVK